MESGFPTQSRALSARDELKCLERLGNPIADTQGEHHTSWANWTLHAGPPKQTGNHGAHSEMSPSSQLGQQNRECGLSSPSLLFCGIQLSSICCFETQRHLWVCAASMGPPPPPQAPSSWNNGFFQHRRLPSPPQLVPSVVSGFSSPQG